MPVLAAATLELNADSAKLEEDLGRAVQKGAMLGSMLGQVVGDAIVKGVEKLYEGVKASVEYRASLSDLSKVVGENAQALDGWVRTVQLSGGTAQQAESSIVKLTRTLNDIGDEGKKAAQALDAIGLASAQVAKMSPTAAMLEIAKALDKYEDGAGKVAVAQALLGREGAKLLPVLKDMAQEGMQQGKITAEQAAAAERLGNQWRRLQQQGGELGRSIANEVIPWIANLIEQFRVGKELAGGMAQMMLLFGGGSPFGDSKGAIAAIEDYQREIEKIDKLREDRKRRGDTDPAGELDVMQADLRKKIEFAKLILRQQSGGLTGEVFPGEPEPQGKSALTFNPAGKDRAAAAKRGTDAAMEAARREQQILDEAAKATQDYYAKIGKAREADAAQAAKDRETMMRQVREFTEQQIEDDMRMEQIAANVGERLQETNNFARDLGLTFTSAFEDAVVSGKKLSDVMKALEVDIARLVLRKSIVEPGAKAITDFVTPFATAAGQSLKSLIPSFDVGTDWVPRDMLAVVHQGEAIVPASENRRGRDSAPVNVNFNIQATDNRSFLQNMAQNERYIVAVINKALERSGQPGALIA